MNWPLDWCSPKLRTNVVGGEQIFDQVSERTRESLLEFSQKAFSSSYEKLSPNYSKTHSNDALKINSRGGLRLEREPNFRSAFFCKVFNDSNINIRENPTRKAAYPLELINWTTSTAASQVPRQKKLIKQKDGKFYLRSHKSWVHFWCFSTTVPVTDLGVEAKESEALSSRVALCIVCKTLIIKLDSERLTLLSLFPA